MFACAPGSVMWNLQISTQQRLIFIAYPTQANPEVLRSFYLVVSDALPPVVYRPLFYGQSQKIEWQANYACR